MKGKVLRGLPCLDCLASLEGKKATPSGLKRLLSKFRDARLADLEGLVNANNMTNL